MGLTINGGLLVAAEPRPAPAQEPAPGTEVGQDTGNSTKDGSENAEN